MEEPPAHAAPQGHEESPGGVASVDGGRLDLSPSSPQFAIGVIDEKETLKSVPLRRPSGRIARRHSTQSGDVYPVADASGESPAQKAAKLKTPLRRSVSTRVLRGLSTSSLVPRLSFANGFNATGSKVNADAEARTEEADTAHHCENPYEEMMVRFQIRQLQRSASVQSEDRRGYATSGRGIARDGAGEGSDRGQPHELGRVAGLSGRNTSEHVSSTLDVGGRTASYQRAADRTSLNHSLGGGHPPLESGTSSAQLAEQFNLAFERDGLAGRDSSWLVSTLMVLHSWQYRLCRPISPYSTTSQVRYAVTLMATITYVLWFPLELAFPDQNQLTNVDAAIGIVLGLDTLFAVHTGYVSPTGAVVLSHRHILWHYIKTRLPLDVALCVPLVMHANRSSTGEWGGKWMTFALDVLSIERLMYITRFVRMIWLIRANQSGSNFWAWLMYSRYSHLIRIAGIVTMLVCIAHYIACVWTVLLEESDAFDAEAMAWPAQYAASFYAALLLLQGEGVPTDTAGQNLFASLSVLVGSIVLAVVFGHVAILVANFNANFTSYQRKMEAVIAMTAKLQLPAPLRQRIHEYYEHLWHEYECIDGEIVQFSKELSHTLGLEVVLFKYMELVMHVPFWRDSTPDFQKQLMLRLDVRVYLPNDFIMREGEVDDEFYMINRGHCELSRAFDRFERVTTTMIAGRSGPSTSRGMHTSRGAGGLTARRRAAAAQAGQINDGHRQSAYELDEVQRRYYSSNGGVGRRGCEIVVSRGQAFGDLALLMNYQRAANVRAITHVEMCVLSRADFQAVLTRYPEDRHRVVVDMITSYMQSYEASQSQCPLLDLVRSVYSPEAIAEACAKAGAVPPLLPSRLTARQAAEKIYLAINVDLQDTTLKFGVGVNIREQLVELRERRRQKRSQQTPKPGASKASRNDEPSSQSRHDSGASVHSERTNPPRKPTPESPTAETLGTSAEGHDQVQADQPQSLQKRLEIMEERELVILRALQELQSNLQVLRARLAAAEAPPAPSSRKRSTPGSDAPVARPPLLQRMGSLVGLSSGAALESKPPLPEAKKASPTRYADELFGSQAPSSPSHQTEAQRLGGFGQERHQRARPRLQPIHKPSESAFKLSPEVEKLIAATEASLLAGRPSSGASSPSASEPQRPQPLVKAGAAQRRRNFQRQRSRSLQKLEEAYQASTKPSTAATPAAAAPQGQERRRMFQRKASQSLRALADAATAVPAQPAPRGSVGSISTAQTRILQRMSSFVADSSGPVNSKPSPTRYADALFRRRSREPPKGKNDDSSLPT
jgi:CRP-like cAMP-binding protein